MNTTTKKGKGFTQLSKPLVAVLAIIVGGLALALTDAGTVIKNLATVTYEDSTGEEYIATSNEAQVTVAEVFAAILTSDNTVNGNLGDTVVLPHTITNTGNSADTFNITLTSGVSDLNDVYVDTNGNGQIDPGEPTLAALGGVTPSVGAGETLQLLVSVVVPAGTTTHDLVATSVGGGDTLDENADGTGGLVAGNNRDTITATAGAILTSTKSSVFDGTTLTYTLTTTNTGDAAAANVQIFDTIPALTGPGTFTLVSSNTGSAGAIPTTFYDHTTDGFELIAGFNAGDSLGGDLQEPVGVDMNGNGVANEVLGNSFLLQSPSVGVDETVIVIFTVDVLTPNSDEIFKNTFCSGTGITGTDPNDTFALGGNNQCSNETIDQAAPTFAVQITDTQDTTLDGTADAAGGAGTDADTVDNDVQFVAEAGVAEVVEYKLYIQNDSNREDFMDIAVANDGTFPAGTIFTFWNQSGNVPLVDNNNNGTVDAGLFQPGDDAIIVVKAQLPVVIVTGAVAEVDVTTEAGAILAENGANLVLEGGDYFLDVTDNDGADDNVHNAAGGDGIIGNDAATEFTDVSSAQLNDSEVFAAIISISSEGGSTIVTDHVAIALGKIVAYRFDLANSQDAINVVPDFDDADLNAHDGATIITVGNDDFDDNFDENGSNDQSPVSSGNGLGDGEVVRGESVTFPLFIRNNGSLSETFDLTAAAVAGFTIDIQSTGGATITDTGVLAPGAVFEYQVVVTVNGDAPNGLSTFDFTATSPTSSTATTDLSDTVTDGIVVEVATCVIGVSGAAPLELAAGAAVDFTHTVTNIFNLDVVYTFTSAITEFEEPGWATELRTAAGAALLSTLDEDGGTAGIQITVTANSSLTFVQRLTAPAGADIAETALGTVTIDADNVLCIDENVVDKATITIDGVQITKQVAEDDNCDCAADGAFSLDAGDKQPGACVVWLLEATNSSGAAVDNVVVRDPLSQFTAFHDDGIYDLTLPGYTGAAVPQPGAPAVASGPFQSCSGAPTCTLADVVVGPSLAITADEVEFTFGTLANGDIARGSVCAQIQ